MKRLKLFPGFMAGLLFLTISCAKDPVIVTGLALDKINATRSGWRYHYFSNIPYSIRCNQSDC